MAKYVEQLMIVEAEQLSEKSKVGDRVCGLSISVDGMGPHVNVNGTIARVGEWVVSSPKGFEVFSDAVFKAAYKAQETKGSK